MVRKNVPRLFSEYKNYHPTSSHPYFAEDVGDTILQTKSNFLPGEKMASYPKKQYSL